MNLDVGWALVLSHLPYLVLGLYLVVTAVQLRRATRALTRAAVKLLLRRRRR
jgi:hypothetical protein